MISSKTSQLTSTRRAVCSGTRQARSASERLHRPTVSYCGLAFWITEQYSRRNRPRGSRHHRRLRCDRQRHVLQRQAVAARDRQIRDGRREQVACRQQERSRPEEGRRVHSQPAFSFGLVSAKVADRIFFLRSPRSSRTSLVFPSLRHQPRMPPMSSRLS